MNRREVLKGLGAAGIVAGGVSGTAGATGARKNNTITLQAQGEQVRYRIVVNGMIRKGPNSGETDEVVDDQTVAGLVGGRSKDDYVFTGQITEFEADGSVRVTVNGRKVEDPVGQPRLPNKVSIQGVGKRADYAFTVTGTVVKGPRADGGDRVRGDTVTGAVTDEGVDDYRYSGAITFDSDDPLNVSLTLNQD